MMKPVIFPLLLAAALPAADSGIVPGMNAFTTACYRQLAHGDANLILSPFNISTALSMVLGGARGATADQIAATLHQQYGPSYDSALASLVAGLAKAGNTGSNELLAGNGVWVQQGFPIQPAFQRTVAGEYHAPLTPLNFATSAEAARAEMNRWTARHTKDKIRELLPPGSVNARTRFVLTSAIYFYGQWQHPFLTSRTQPAPFTPEAGAAVQTSFMNQTTRFGYTETPSAQVLEMPYAGTGIAFDVLLPKKSRSLADVEKSLTSESVAGWVGDLSGRIVQVSLPKWRVESEFFLGRTLSAMGMPAAFGNRADFSGIDGRGALSLSEVVHKAYVDVSEQGTEAAAATGATMMLISAARIPEPPVIFRADHPFLFLIRDTRSGAVLFIGRVTSPKS